ncbi:ATP-dependent DNA ligase [Arthrobacter gandavensis]|uniref:ATP-dependent DNA ligase n=1 Tax=Arthrobacter gandavensis TaxID=169960 RepID=UPI00188F21EE|nr:ATP-dependent DNA ligase [Arthrobacter gandavensis]MBF4995069.1 ATP-dependent DNA ligase [Arthrobacter gandavensis]
MELPVPKTISPMLAKPAAGIPEGDYAYEPKWDGFRAMVYREGGNVEILSRNGRSLNRYFPELSEAFLHGLPEECVVDGEIILISRDGSRLDFDALQQRIHPAGSRVSLLADQTPASFVAFDLLALDGTDVTGEPFRRRRENLVSAVGKAGGRLHLTRQTLDAGTAREWFRRFEGAGLDGVVAKPLEGRYEPGKRAMTKVKHRRTADCVVAGYRVHKSGADRIGSLLLGLYDAAGNLANVGVLGAFPMARRAELFDELQPLVTWDPAHPWSTAGPEPGTRTPRSSEGSRWTGSKDLSFTPLRPERVVEVAYDHMEGHRFRHPPSFLRWRPDRDPASCGYGQLEEPVRYELGDVLLEPAQTGKP